MNKSEPFVVCVAGDNNFCVNLKKCVFGTMAINICETPFYVNDIILAAIQCVCAIW